jgi:uncharacterized protein with PQ loop repeat
LNWYSWVSAIIAAHHSIIAYSHLLGTQNVVGYVASLITAIQVARQLVDAWKVPRAEGVSWITWDLAIVQSIGLLVFSVAHSLTAASIINAYVGLVSLAILARLLTAGYSRLRSWPAIIVVLTVTACIAWSALLGPAAAGSLGSVASAFVWIPQAIHSFRSRSAVGLSWPFVFAGLTSSALWIAYAILVAQWRLLIPPISAIVALAVTASYSLMQPTHNSADV